MKRVALLALPLVAGCGRLLPAPHAGRAGRGRALPAAARAPHLDGPGTFRETFSAISYAGQEGAPSYASILDLDRPGCWRLTLTTGELRAHVDIRAVAL